MIDLSKAVLSSHNRHKVYVEGDAQGVRVPFAEVTLGDSLDGRDSNATSPSAGMTRLARRRPQSWPAASPRLSSSRCDGPGPGREGGADASPARVDRRIERQALLRPAPGQDERSRTWWHRVPPPQAVDVIHNGR